MRSKLTDAKCKKAKAGRYADGGNLYLLVKPDGRKSWLFRFVDPVTGKRRDMGLGRYGKHDVTLAKARKKAGKARNLLKQSKDPIEKRKRKVEKLKRKLEKRRKEQANRLTFRQCRDRFIKANKAEWKNGKHTAQWISTLDTYAKPILDKPVADIGQDDVLACIEPLWTTKTETMTRVRQRIERVLNWATVRKLRKGENPARWKGHLDTLLPKPTKLKKVQHRPALPYLEIGAFMVKLRAKDSLAAKALELQILTATRPGEVCAAQWSEFDLNTKLWTIPTERMKASKEHTIPLSQQAVDLLKSLPRVSGSDYLFPGLKKGTHMTTAAGMKLLKELWPGITAHGMRSTFRDWAGETTAYKREVIEMAMAHQLKDKAEAAYARGNLLDKRTKLMRDWANYCGQPSADTASVTPIRGAK
jgi:integrase